MLLKSNFIVIDYKINKKRKWEGCLQFNTELLFKIPVHQLIKVYYDSAISVVSDMCAMQREDGFLYPM